jgi:hypothetical protein
MSDESNTLCSQLDAFLDGELPPSEHAEFLAHMDACEPCRDAAQQQQWIDGLLRSGEAAALETPSMRPTIPLRRHARRRILAAAVAASIVAALAAPFIPLPRRDGLGEGLQEVASLPSPKPSEQRAIDASPPPPASIADPSPSPSLQERRISDKPVATFASNGNAIAVPLAGDDAEVTVVQLVPTVAAQVRRVHLTSEQPFHNHGG